MRDIEVFSADCCLCKDAIIQITDLACSSCNIIVRQMDDDKNAERAKELGVKSVPAVAIDGELVDCCASRGINIDVLKAAGLGQPV